MCYSIGRRATPPIVDLHHGPLLPAAKHGPGGPGLVVGLELMMDNGDVANDWGGRVRMGRAALPHAGGRAPVSGEGAVSAARPEPHPLQQQQPLRGTLVSRGVEEVVPPAAPIRRPGTSVAVHVYKVRKHLCPAHPHRPRGAQPASGSTPHAQTHPAETADETHAEPPRRRPHPRDIGQHTSTDAPPADERGARETVYSVCVSCPGAWNRSTDADAAAGDTAAAPADGGERTDAAPPRDGVGGAGVAIAQLPDGRPQQLRPLQP
eukprot:gene15561-48632_t